MNTDSAEQTRQAVETYLDHALYKSQHTLFLKSRETGLSLSQMIILRKLHWQGQATPSQLSEFLEMSRAALSQSIDKLVEQGLVLRSEDQEDRRVKILGLTTLGKKFLDELHSHRYTWLPEELSALTPNEKEIIHQAFILLSKTIHTKETIPCSNS